MAPGSRTRQSPCNNPPANFIGEQDKFAGPQDQVRKSDAGSNEAFIISEALTIPLVPSMEDLFIKFMKTFVKSTQARDQE